MKVITMLRRFIQNIYTILKWRMQAMSHRKGEAPASSFDLQGLNRQMPAVQAAATEFLDILWPACDDHLETIIAGAGSTAGATLLRELKIDVSELSPGTRILSLDIDAAEGNLFKFLELAAQHMGLRPYSKGYHSVRVPAAHNPRQDLASLVHRLQKPFDALCTRFLIRREFFPFVAVYAAMKVVAASHETGALDERFGRQILASHFSRGLQDSPPATAAIVGLTRGDGRAEARPTWTAP